MLYACMCGVQSVEYVYSLRGGRKKERAGVGSRWMGRWIGKLAGGQVGG